MGAVVFVGGVGDIAAGIADAGGKDAGHFPDQVLHAPKATPGKDGALGLLGHLGSPCSPDASIWGFRRPGSTAARGRTALSRAAGNCRWPLDAISDAGNREATM